MRSAESAQVDECHFLSIEILIQTVLRVQLTDLQFVDAEHPHLDAILEKMLSVRDMRGVVFVICPESCCVGIVLQ